MSLTSEFKTIISNT